jgi:pyruvate-formate lyase-activating enzyme/SAM-dependent methyltransferase
VSAPSKNPAAAPGRKRFIVKVGYSCNNGCLFCHAADQQCIGSLPTDQAIDRIADARAHGATGVLLSGGEPTIRKDLLELADACRRHGLAFGLITNGRMLSYAPLLKRLARRGLDYVYLSLHGPEDVHETVTRAPGSFAQTWQAARLLDALDGIQLTVNAVVVRQNLDHLQALVRLLAPLRRARVKFTYVEPKGQALVDDSLIPHPVEAARAIAAALELGERLGMPGNRFGVDGLPHCLDPRLPTLQDDMFTHDIVALREVDEERFFPIDYGNMHRPKACRGCRVGDACRGSWTRTFNRFGDHFLAPVYGGLSNSFNYFPDPGGSASPQRALQLEIDGRKLPFATDTADFSEPHIRHVRDTIEQLYLQLDDRPMVDDFPAQLRKLRRAGPADAAKPLFVPLRKDLFSLADQRVRTLLRSVTGRVLDVGCGQTRYADLLEEKLAASAIDYVALDPAPGDTVRELADARRIRLLTQGIEDASFEPGSFDWVLVLRSHNHLADLWTAYSRVLAALRWGGSLLVVDNVSFGLVRPHVSREAIAAIPPGEGLEHLRDHDQDDAARFLARFPLVEVERQAVGPHSANQWLLLFKKLWPGGQTGVDTYPPAPPDAAPPPVSRHG